MTTIFVTGDRRAPELLALAPVAIEVLKRVVQSPEPVTVATGTNPGVEAAARYIAEFAGLELTVVEQSIDETTGKPNWDARHASLVADEVLFIHGEPETSSIGKSLGRSLSDDVTLTTL